MKRSEINALIGEARAFIAELGVPLPPFAHWIPQTWTSLGFEAREIAERGLGWDVTDFGSGRFAEVGLLLFTLRNGTLQAVQAQRGKMYAEKLLIVGDAQVTPTHFHPFKTEDIIHRGGPGTLLLELHWAASDDTLSHEPLTVSVDGLERHLEAGDVLRLEAGESVTLPSRMYHRFWAEGGRVLAAEVSTVNDDATDNHFLEGVGRFPEVEEDVAPTRLLVGDYAQFYPHAPSPKNGF